MVVQSFVVARACLELWKAPDDLDAIDVGQHAVDCHHDIVVIAAKYQSLLTVRGPVNPVDGPRPDRPDAEYFVLFSSLLVSSRYVENSL